MTTSARFRFSARRRRALFTLAATGCGPMLAGLAGATEVATGGWPARPLRLLCPLGAGTSADGVARLVARGLGDALGQAVIVENRPGAATNIASELAARAPADGYTLLFGTSSLAILPATAGARAIDAVEAFAPVSILTTQPVMIAAHPSFKGSNFADIVRMAKEQPETIAFSTSGIGGVGHLTAAWAMNRANIKLVHIPYTATRALTDVLSGQVPLAFSFPGTVLPLIRAGQMKGIAVTGLKRLDAAPEIPTLDESGLPGFDVSNWMGILTPAGTPADIVARLHRELVQVMATPEVQSRLRGLAFDIVAGTPAEFAQTLRQETSRWKSVVAAAGLRFE